MAAVGSHPHIVRYYTAWIEKDAAADGEHLYIQLEACDTSVGNLRALKNEAKEADLVEMLRQVRLSHRFPDYGIADTGKTFSFSFSVPDLQSNVETYSIH